MFNQEREDQESFTEFPSSNETFVSEVVNDMNVNVNVGDEEFIADEESQEQYEDNVDDNEVTELSDGSECWKPIVPDDIRPRMHDRFSSLDEVEAMYKSYAIKAGFRVRKSARKENKKGQIQTRWFVCSNQGFPRNKQFDSMEVGPGDRNYRNSNFRRSGCQAGIKVHLMKDKSTYQIFQVVEEHNHVLMNNNDRRFSKYNRQMQYTDYRHVLNSSSYKLGPTRAHRMMSALNGGFEHDRATVVDFQNFRRDVVAVVGNKDARMLVDLMSKRREIAPDYYFEYICNGRELQAVFWADEIARINYKEFGDCISFDGTYRTQRHAMVFVPFLSVDNHKKSVGVGSALISGEIIENYTWVLRAFLRCHLKQPVFVISDQCSSMKQAIPLVFTESKHRLCIWHIMKKVPAKVSMALKQNPEFNDVINKLVWNVRIGPDEFKRAWEQMIVKYNLHGIRWFTDMYHIRKSWIPAYYKDTPMSGLMKTTSRSESSNAYFNLYETFESNLVQFMHNYDFAIEKQRNDHSELESVTRSTYTHMASPLHIEKHASKIYTRTMFFDFQKEIHKAVWFCVIETVELDGVLKYVLICENDKRSQVKAKYKVQRNSEENTVECQCSYFVQNGILCRHALKVLINDKVHVIPERYIMRRWTVGIVPVHVQVARVRYGEIDPEKEKAIRDVYLKVDNLVSRLRNDSIYMAKFTEVIDDFKTEYDKISPFNDSRQQRNDAINEYHGVPVPDDDDVDILPPTGLRNKGCGTGKRLQSKSEMIQERSKRKKRKCKSCGQRTGHDSRNCPSNPI